MATPGKELLGEHYGRDHLTYEEIEELDLKVVTEAGESVPEDDLRGKIFRFEDKDEPTPKGYKEAFDSAEERYAKEGRDHRVTQGTLEKKYDKNEGDFAEHRCSLRSRLPPPCSPGRILHRAGKTGVC